MKCKLTSTLPDDSPFAIHDTLELSAKKLFAHFVESYDLNENVLYHSKTVDALKTLLQANRAKNIPQQTQTILENLPWEVCYSFYKFLLECPHVHITID